MDRTDISSSVVLYRNAAGVVQRVEVDGVNIAHVAKAVVTVEPGELTKLTLTIYVGDVATEDA